MSERPEPDIDHVREAMREHDERPAEEGDEPERERERDDGEDEGDDDE